MRVKIQYTVEADEFIRLAIADAMGYPGLASREAVRKFYERHGRGEEEPEETVDARVTAESTEAIRAL